MMEFANPHAIIAALCIIGSVCIAGGLIIWLAVECEMKK